MVTKGWLVYLACCVGLFFGATAIVKYAFADDDAEDGATKSRGLRESVVAELSDIASALGSLNQSYAIAPVIGSNAATGGSFYIDINDDEVYRENRRTAKVAAAQPAAKQPATGFEQLDDADAPALDDADDDQSTDDDAAESDAAQNDANSGESSDDAGGGQRPHGHHHKKKGVVHLPPPVIVGGCNNLAWLYGESPKCTCVVMPVLPPCPTPKCCPTHRPCHLHPHPHPHPHVPTPACPSCGVKHPPHGHPQPAPHPHPVPHSKPHPHADPAPHPDIQHAVPEGAQPTLAPPQGLNGGGDDANLQRRIDALESQLHALGRQLADQAEEVPVLQQ